MGKLAVKVTKLSKIYPNGVCAVKDIDLEIWEGECFGLLGPNGAGKSTTLQILQGLLSPTTGHLELFGLTYRTHENAIRELMGGILQENVFYDRTKVGELVVLFASLYQNPIPVETALREMGIGDLKGRYLRELSGGQRQRAFLAAALVGDPKILFLDEPTTGLDPASRQDFWHSIKRIQAQGKTIVLTTHYMEEAEVLADRLAIIDEGQIIEKGTVEEVIERVTHGLIPKKPAPKFGLNDVFLKLTGRTL